MTASDLLGILSTSFYKSSEVMMWNHELITTSISCCLFDGRFAATARFSRDHRFSMGFRSGLFPGHSSTWMLFSLNHDMHFFAVWHGAPSCWNVNGWSAPKMSRADASNLECRTSLMYFSAFTTPFSTCSRPTPSRDMHLHTIMLSGCFLVAVVHSGMQSSPGWRWTYRTPSLPKIDIRVSSVHRTCFHWSGVLLACSFAHFRCFWRCTAFRKGFFIKILAHKPADTNRRRTVRSETCTPASESDLLMSMALDVRF